MKRTKGYQLWIQKLAIDSKTVLSPHDDFTTMAGTEKPDEP